jgi:hypothetical protein
LAAQSDARPRAQETPLQQRGRLGQRHVLLNHVQTSRSFARDAGNHQQVARLRSGAREPFVLLDPTCELHRHDQWAAHCVAADERDVVLLGQLQQSGGKARNPGLRSFGQRQRERHPRGLGAHGRDVAEIHRERAIADCAGIDAAREVHAFDDRVDRDDESTSVAVDVEHRRVVADAEQHVGAMIVVREVTSDDVEFTETHRDSPW